MRPGGHPFQYCAGHRHSLGLQGLVAAHPGRLDQGGPQRRLSPGLGRVSPPEAGRGFAAHHRSARRPAWQVRENFHNWTIQFEWKSHPTPGRVARVRRTGLNIILSKKIQQSPYKIQVFTPCKSKVHVWACRRIKNPSGIDNQYVGFHRFTSNRFSGMLTSSVECGTAGSAKCTKRWPSAAAMRTPPGHLQRPDRHRR